MHRDGTLLALDVARYGWVRGHRVHRRRILMRRIVVGARRTMAVALILIAVVLMGWAVVGCEQDCRHIGGAVPQVEPAQCREAQTAGVVGVVGHACHGAARAGTGGTMKCRAFQGAA